MQSMSNGDSQQRNVKKVVLAYSGGLDTSIILKWLQTTYGCEVVTFTADLGQGEELEPARRKAELMGIKPEHISDHGISLGIYLRDPDGNGVEVYYELPRAEWPVDYHVFSRDKVGRGRFPGPWDAEEVTPLPVTAPQPVAAE